MDNSNRCVKQGIHVRRYDIQIEFLGQFRKLDLYCKGWHARQPRGRANCQGCHIPGSKAEQESIYQAFPDQKSYVLVYQLSHRKPFV